MIAPARKRRKAEPARESSVYDGSRFLGRIVPQFGAFVARSASGRAIGGTFPTDVEAMRAICAHDRQARLATEAAA